MSNNKIHYCQLDKHEAMSEHAILGKVSYRNSKIIRKI